MEVEPLVFREVDGQTILIFHEDEQGRITHAFQDFEPHEAYIKSAWYESMTLHLAVLAVCVIVFLSALVGWPLSALINRRRGKTGTVERLPRQARWLADSISALNLFPVGIVVAALLIVSSNPLEIMSEYDAIFAVPLAFPVLATVLTVGAVVFTVLAWRNKYWGLLGRVHYTLVALAALTFAWWLNYWNLLGWRF